ncbi:MAG: helix-turn-helix domain-containing protein [Clostridiaceae bacterium]|nr:helix-turn-helix domain-containing protein [Clostridiaceae bacterium]
MPVGQILFEYYGELMKVDHIRRSAVYIMSPHMHQDRYEIYYLLSGSRDYLVRDGIYTVNKGEMILIPAGELHKSLESDRPEHERIVIEFDRRFIETDLLSVGLPLFDVFQTDHYVLHLPDGLRQRAEHLLFDIIRELRDEPEGYEAMIRTSLIQLLILIYRCHDRRACQQEALLPGRKAWIAGITRYIHDHYAEPLTLPDLARQFAVSSYYLSRCFHQETGMHLPDYINLVRVKEAKQRLLAGQTQIAAIALAVGYTNVTHFGRVFHKVHGVSPSELKRTIRLSRGKSALKHNG